MSHQRRSRPPPPADLRPKSSGPARKETEQDTIGNAALQDRVTPALDVASILDFALHEAHAEDPHQEVAPEGEEEQDPTGHSSGLGSEEAKNAFLSGGHKPIGAGKKETTDPQSFDHSRITGKGNVVKGKWGDTLQGQRANDRAGSGIYNERDYAGGGQDHAKADDAEADGAKAGDAKAGGDGGGGSRDYGFLRALGDLWNAATDIKLRAPGEPRFPSSRTNAVAGVRGTPRPDDDMGGEYRPVAIGQGTSPVKTGGQAGGAGDGRGEQDPANEGPAQQADTAVMTAITKADGVIKDRSGGKIALEEMMKQATFTDPKKG